MLVKNHIAIGAISSIIIYFIFQITILQATIIFLASFLIDFDHYLLFVLLKKNLSLKEAVRFFSVKREEIINTKKEQEKEPIKDQKGQIKDYQKPILIFHGIEFLLILVVLSIFYNLFIFVLIGVVIHLILDYVELVTYCRPSLYTKVSQIYVYFNNKGKIPI